MFTGLIESTGRVRGLARSGIGARLELEAAWPDEATPRRGDSVAVNGACLTVLEPTASGFAADLSPETLDRTLLGRLRPGDLTNLERALRLGDRLGGHLVQGHVDGVVRVISIRPESGFSRWRLSLPSENAAEVAAKGSVSLDGVSLTVAAVIEGAFEVALIPETLRATTLAHRHPGDLLHLETDVLAKYVGRHLALGDRTSLLEQVFGDGSDHA